MVARLIPIDTANKNAFQNAAVAGASLATDAETQGGTLDDKAVTPARLAARLPTVDIRKYWTGAWNTTVEAAITALNAAPGLGYVVQLPAEEIDLTAGVTTPITRGGIWFKGAGPAATNLLGDLGTMFTWGDGASLPSDGGLSDATITYASPDAASQVVLVDRFARLRFEHLVLDNVRQLAELGTSSVNTANNILFSDIKGSTDPAAGSVVFDVAHGAGLYLNDVSVSAKGVGFPANATDAHPANDTTAFRFGQGSWDTVIAQNVVTNRYNRGLDLNAGAASILSNMWFTNSVFDYSKTNGIIARGTGGSVRSVYFTGGWAVATDANSVEVSGSGGAVTNIHFTDVVGRQAGQNNWRLSHTAMADVRLTSCHGIGANRLAGTNTGSQQDDLVIAASGVSVLGGRFGEDGQPYVGFTNQGRYGVNIAANLNFSVENVMSTGATDAFLVAANTVTGRRALRNNSKDGQARPNYSVVTAPAVPTSGVGTNHFNSYTSEYYIYGGTVTRVDKNGAQIADTVPCMLTLRPGDSYTITYSVAPTIREYRLP